MNDWLSNELKDLFDDRHHQAEGTLHRPRSSLNYSWTVPLEIGAPGMKTVMTATLWPVTEDDDRRNHLLIGANYGNADTAILRRRRG